MDLESAREFLRQHHRAVLATYHADGRAQLSPVLCTVDGAGRVTVSTRETAVKTRNLIRDPRAGLCVLTAEFFGPWLQLEGLADVVHLPEALEPLVEYYRAVAGEHPDWDDYRAAMQRERRVLLRIAITRAGPAYRG